MTSTRRFRCLLSFHPIAALAAIVVLAGLSACAGTPTGLHTAPPPAPTQAAAPALVPPPALRLEGVPPLPQSLLEAAQRYNGVAGHGFVDWHPTRREMLVSHRAPGASTTQLWRLRAPLAPLEPLTSGADPVASAQWEPRDGRYIVFARGSGGDEAFQLYRLDPETRATVQLTPAGERHTLAGWIKSRGLALVSSVPLDRTATAGRRTEVVTTLSTIDPLNPASRQVLAELPGGGWFGAAVSPDEKQVAITRYLSATESQVWLLDLGNGPSGTNGTSGPNGTNGTNRTNGQRRQLLPAPGQALTAAHFVAGWSADGASLLFTSNRAGEFLELMRVQLASGAVTRLTAGIPWDVNADSASADRRTSALVVNADGRDELRLLDNTSGAALALPTLPGGSITRGEFHPEQVGPEKDLLALVVNSAQGPSQIHVLDLQRNSVTAWTQPVGTQGLDLQSLPGQKIVRWQSFDGRTISGVLTLPPARFAGKRPVVMLVHGGPEGQSKQGWQGRWNYLVQQLGVAVFEPNVRGSSGYGKTFISLDNGRLREDSVKDMGTAIDWMATQPQLDAQRVLVVGGSYGGYMALAASTRLADRIAGASATVGISNFVSFLENTESYRRDLRRVEYGDERDPAMRAFLTEISPLTHVSRITKPLMVVQGKNDPRVPWTESEQIVRSLQQRGTPVWYLLADNEGHGFARRENADFYFAALMQFVAQTLKP